MSGLGVIRGMGLDLVKVRIKSLMIAIAGLALAFAAIHWFSIQDIRTRGAVAVLLVACSLLLPILYAISIFVWACWQILMVIVSFYRRSEATRPLPNKANGRGHPPTSGGGLGRRDHAAGG